MRMPDMPKARALCRNAGDALEATLHSNSESSRFLIDNFYSCAIKYAISLLAAEGVVIRGKDHHKIAIATLQQQGKLSMFEATLFDNLRKIRNDIQYYGTKSEEDINDFYELNKENIIHLVTKMKQKTELFIAQGKKD